MNDVKIHYNAARPAQLQAQVCAQGQDIHIAAGQEKHSPHKTWYVVQQKQARMLSTTRERAKL